MEVKMARSSQSNGIDPGAAREAVVDAAIHSKAELLRAAMLDPPLTLASTTTQVLIPVGTPGPLEFIRTHPTLRLTFNMTQPKKGPGSLLYVVMPKAEAVLARHKIGIVTTTLYPVMIAAAVPTYRLVPVKLPADGKRWDEWNLSRKLLLDQAVDKWLAIRSIGGGYGIGEPDPGAIFPEVKFPDWSEVEWLDRSLIPGDLVIWDDTHPLFKDILHL
jgi:hypothetical protein